MPDSKKKELSSDSDSGPDDRNAQPPAKKSKDAPAKEKEAETGADGEKEWTLEKLRKVRINEFRGRRMVDIREFYEKDGKMLPGKRGISLSLVQWTKLLEVAKEVTEALKNE